MTANQNGTLPDPGTPASPAELAEKLCELRRWAGQPSLRRLRRLGGTRPAADGGGEVDALPQTTLSCVLRGERPASAELVRSFVAACLRTRQRDADVAEQVERWHEAWLVATGHATPARFPVASPPAGHVPRQAQLIDGPRVVDLDERRAVRQALAQGDLPAPTAAPSHPPAVAVEPPQQLPRDAAWFTGREAELERLLALVSDPQQAGAVVISAIDGMAGIGKTALAVHVAHRLADRFPDGQLFIDLHGYSQGLEPIEPAEALDRLLRDLGVRGTEIPTSLDARAALYRTRLAHRRMLIVLDNAATEGQVAPLLPGSAGPLVLVTSRRRLAGLDHTHTLSLDTMPMPDAITLFARATGQGRPADQPAELVAELVQLCGRLPLAIQIAAARLRSHPAWHLGDLVKRLRDQQHRLGELEAGRRSITAALDLSYQHLSPDEQQAYRMLGRHTGPEFDAYATAALLEITLPHAGRVLDQLLEVHLLQEATSGRYRFHDLTRAHAHTVIGAHTAPAPDAALRRLLDYYRHTAAVAMDTAYSYEREHRPQVPPALTPSPVLPDPAAALAWLDTELPNLLAAAGYAAEHGLPAHLLDLSTILHQHLRTRGRYHDAETLHQLALATASADGDDQAGKLEALICLGDTHRLQGRPGQAADHFAHALRIARATGNRTGELTALAGLGNIHRRQGGYEQAADHYQQVLQIARATGNRTGELTALAGLGNIHRRQGRYEQAAYHSEHALRIARATGNRAGELTALAGLGNIHLLQGRYEQAADHYQQALQIARATGNPTGEVTALTCLGRIDRLQGRYPQAADHLEQGLRIARTTGNRNGQLNALTGLGHIHRLQGRYELAADHYQRLLNLAQESGDRNWQFEAWQGLGRLSQATGQPDAAITNHELALTLAGELGQPVDQARAHDGLAHAHLTLNQHGQARQHWQHALDLLTHLGIDNTEDEGATAVTIRANLTALTQQ